MGGDVDGALNADRDRAIPLAKVGGQEVYNVDNLDSRGKSMSCQKLSPGPHTRNHSHSTKHQILLSLLKYTECLS